MADNQNPFGQTQGDAANPPQKQDEGSKGQEANAADLLSLWGAPTRAEPAAKPKPAVAEPLKPSPTPVPSPVPPPPPPRPTQLPPPYSPPPPTSQSTKPVPPPPASAQLPWENVATPQRTKTETELKPMEPPIGAPPPRHTPAPLHPAPKPVPKPAPKPEPELRPVRPPSPPKPKPIPVVPEPEEKPLPKKKEVFEGEIVTEPIKKSPPGRAEARPIITAPEGRNPPATPKKTSPPEDDFVKPLEKDEQKIDESEGFGSQLDEFLQELNLSKEQIFKVVGCVVLIVVLAIGGIYGYRYYKNQKNPTPIAEEPKKAEITADQTGIVSSQKVGEITILRPELIGDTGMSATVSIGREVEGATDIARYIMTFRRIQNGYAVNINDLLNRSTDRRGSFAGHLALLKKLYNEGTAEVAKMQEELDTIKLQYDPQKQKQDEDDANFFEQMNALNAKTAEDILADFINVSRQTVSLRARFKAIQRIKSFYDRGLPKLSARIKDIELNEEPLVSGLKVYDVTGSDLQLIVPIESGIPEADRLQTPAFPLLPVQSYQSTGGKDFITQPGGGFAGEMKK